MSAQDKYGGSVWESNPPFDPRRTESPALKAGKITGPLSPPEELYGSSANGFKRGHLAGAEERGDEIVEGG